MIIIVIIRSFQRIHCMKLQHMNYVWAWIGIKM